MYTRDNATIMYLRFNQALTISSIHLDSEALKEKSLSGNICSLDSTLTGGIYVEVVRLHFSFIQR